MIKSGSSWASADAWVTAFMAVATAVGIQSGVKNTAQQIATLTGKVPLWIGLGLLAVGLAGCRLPDGSYDAGRTEQIKATVTPIVSSAVRRVVQNSPDSAPQIRLYLGATADVFCEASRTGKLTPSQVIAAMDRATQGQQAGVDPLIIDAKNGLLVLYGILYADTWNVDLPQDQWAKNVCDVMCAAISQGLADSVGLPTKGAKRLPKIVVKGLWWDMVASNGRIVCHSEQYQSEAKAREVATKLGQRLGIKVQ
jgi:hypothetical protein